MKKYILLFLAFVLILSGCDKVTQSTNTKTTESQSANTEEVSKDSGELKAAEGEVASSEIIAPIYNENLIKSNKSEMKLEDIIAKVKDVFNIGNEFDEVSTEEYSGEGSQKTYNVNLYNTTNNESAWFSTDVYGNVISYSNYKNSGSRVEINYTRSEAENKVRELLVKLYGDVAKDFLIENKAGYDTFENPNYYVQVTRVVNGIKVPSDTLTVDVNKTTSEIAYLQINTSTNYDFSDTSYFADLDEVKENEEAFKKFKEVNMMLKGHLGFNSKQRGIYREIKYVPIYGIYGEQLPIDGVTLEPNYYLVNSFMPYGAGAVEEAKAEPSDAEKSHLDDVNKQSSAEEAEKAAREMFGLGNDYKVSYSNFGNYMSTKGIYTWSISFNGANDEYVSVTLLANDLTLVSYNAYSPELNSKGESKGKSPETYLSQSNSFVSEKGKINLENLEVSVRSNKPQTGNNHVVSYVRENKDGTFIYSDTVTVTIDKKSDKIINYYRNWDFELDDTKLPDDFNISEDEAFEILKDNYGFELAYRRDYGESDTKSVKPFYMLGSSQIYSFNDNYIVNAENEDIINTSGERVQLSESITYSDLDEADRPKIIEEMADNNIGFFGGELNPKEQITQIDLFRLFLASNGYQGRDYTDDEVYEQLEYNNLLNGEPRNPEKEITQRDYARYIARYKSYGDIGKLNNIFKDRFEDLSSSDKDFGYLSIAKEKGYIETTENDKLDPDKKITREMALYYLYVVKSN